MLDLAFLGITIYIFINANKGLYKETACNIALVLGILAGMVGCVLGILGDDGAFVALNFIVMIMGFALRFVALHLVKLYNHREVEKAENLEREALSRMRSDDIEEHCVYTDETFDDAELRFGKGGYTDPKL